MGREGEGVRVELTVAQLTEPTPNWLVFTIPIRTGGKGRNNNKMLSIISINPKGNRTSYNNNLVVILPLPTRS